MKDIHAALMIGTRRVLAMTCWGCGQLKGGDAFHRYPRRSGDGRRYIDRRCGECRWRHLTGPNDQARRALLA